MISDNFMSLRELKEKVLALENLDTDITHLKHGSYSLDADAQARIPGRLKGMQDKSAFLRLEMIRILADWI